MTDEQRKYAEQGAGNWTPGTAPGERIYKGLPAAGGVVIGPAYVYEREEVYVTERILSVVSLY